MKKIAFIFLCLISFNVSAQDFDGHNWKAPYTLSVPEGWGVERFLIPIEFAPSIPYKGVEDIRFAPGWGNAQSEEYWSYAFLWYLDEVPITNEATIQTNLNAYYTGLIGRNIERRKIPKEKLFPVKTSVKEVNTESGDQKTFKGTIDMLDYMEQRPITLNCVVHVKSCPGQAKGFIFYEISPKPSTDKIWKSLELLWKNFDCKVNEKK
ncbi:MAG TPA: hypothetical protein VGQ59_21175 [Cyclobacteriaceae bacterium]|jgi:hypothetical protein|nr:hypothetical protein [Cyclobacteriaceae bacterium]